MSRGPPAAAGSHRGASPAAAVPSGPNAVSTQRRVSSRLRGHWSSSASCGERSRGVRRRRQQAVAAAAPPRHSHNMSRGTSEERQTRRCLRSCGWSAPGTCGGQRTAGESAGAGGRGGRGRRRALTCGTRPPPSCPSIYTRPDHALRRQTRRGAAPSDHGGVATCWCYGRGAAPRHISSDAEKSEMASTAADGRFRNLGPCAVATSCALRRRGEIGVLQVKVRIVR